VRVDATRFTPNRTQQRTLKRHQQLRPLVAELSWSSEHYALYSRYQALRHPGGGMDDDSRTQYSEFLLASRVNTRLVEFREEDGTSSMYSSKGSLRSTPSTTQKRQVAWAPTAFCGKSNSAANSVCLGSI
jgi:arginyl-tRNA--protein-N-Asp/Glu arginylyltransferase